MPKCYYVYFLTNYQKTVLYIGVTNNLERRVAEHKNHLHPGFTQQYKCHYLIYYEEYYDIHEAIHREKVLKKWNRAKKNDLIAVKNPNWDFLM